jgi:starch phosphorylase
VSKLHGETARAMWRNVEGACPIEAITNGVHRRRGRRSDPRRGRCAGEAVGCARGLKHSCSPRSVAGRTWRSTPATCSIGFARRAAGYKRSDLLLRDEARLTKLLEQQNVRVLFAGKAHPDDGAGHDMVTRLVQGARKHPGQVLFLENYDMASGRLLTRGCDVWLNNPVRPLEASGTSA